MQIRLIPRLCQPAQLLRRALVRRRKLQQTVLRLHVLCQKLMHMEHACADGVQHIADVCALTLTHSTEHALLRVHRKQLLPLLVGAYRNAVYITQAACIQRRQQLRRQGHTLHRQPCVYARQRQRGQGQLIRMTIIAVAEFIRQINAGKNRHQRYEVHALRPQRRQRRLQQRLDDMRTTRLRRRRHAHQIGHKLLRSAHAQTIGIDMHHRLELLLLVERAHNYILLTAILRKIILKERLLPFLKAVIPQLLDLRQLLPADNRVLHYLLTR